MKPCPFCGHPKSRIEEYDGDTWRVCQECRASTRGCRSRNEANIAWNARARANRKTQRKKGATKP